MTTAPISYKTRKAGDRVIKDLVVPMELKADIERRELIAYASVFDVLDRQGDIVVPGAFSDTIKNDGPRVKVLYQHDTNRPIGKPLHLEEDSKGLLTVSKISRVPDGDLVLRLAADGVLDRMSIGFEVVKATEFEDEALRGQLSGMAALFPMYYLEVLKLWEYSPVTFAANDSADVIAVRSAGGGWLPLFNQRAWPHVEEVKTTIVPPVQLAVDIGSFVTWNGQVGKVLSVSGEMAAVQVYEGTTPTSEMVDVRLDELSETDAPKDEEETTEQEMETEENKDIDDDACPTCGKGSTVLDKTDEPPIETYEVEISLIEKLRSFARS